MVGRGIELSSFECVEMAVFDTSGLTGSFQPLNTATQQPETGSEGFEDDIKILKYYNGGTTGITISYDNVKNCDFLPPGATQIIDLQTNHANAATGGQGTKYGRKGQYVYGSGTAGVGNLYIVGYR